MHRFINRIKNPNLFVTLATSLGIGYLLQEDDSLILQEDRNYIFY